MAEGREGAEVQGQTGSPLAPELRDTVLVRTRPALGETLGRLSVLTAPGNKGVTNGGEGKVWPGSRSAISQTLMLLGSSEHPKSHER